MTAPSPLQSAIASEKGRHLTALAAMTTAAFFWAIIEHLGGLVPSRYSPVQTVWSRYLVHLLFMLVFFGPRRGSNLVRTRCFGLQVSRALLMVGMPVSFIFGVALLPVQVVWLVSWISVIAMLAMSAVFLRERVAPAFWLAAGIGWLGIWAMSGAHLPPLSWRYLAPFGMGSCFAIYVVTTRRMHGESTQAKLFHTALWVFLVFSVVVPFKWKMPSLDVLIVYALIGLSGYLGLYFLDKSIEMAPVSLTAPLIYTVPLWSCVQQSIITGKPPGSMAVAGALIIVLTSAFIILAVWSGRVRLTAPG
jgi:drug/metabolite transporter (DMT)-like permease